MAQKESGPYMAGDTGEVLLVVRHDTAAITAADGKYTPLQTDAVGNLRAVCQVYNGTTYGPLTTDASGNLTVQALGYNGTANTILQLDASNNLKNSPQLYNGATYEALRGNTEVTVWASAARAEGATNSSDQTNHCARGIRINLNITAVAGTSPTLDVKLQSKCPSSGTYTDIPGAAFAQQTGAASLDLVVYPGAVTTANRSVASVLPRTWRVVATVGGTDTPTATFSLAGSYVI